MQLHKKDRMQSVKKCERLTGGCYRGVKIQRREPVTAVFTCDLASVLARR